MSGPAILPLAHLGHWTWVLYILPIAIVLVSIIRTTISERRGDRAGKGKGRRGRR